MTENAKTSKPATICVDRFVAAPPAKVPEPAPTRR